jgi:hypothetical protein
VIGIKEFFNNGKDVLGMDGDTAFFLHNRLIFKRVRPFQILFQPAKMTEWQEDFEWHS